jgi:hypothetical protein
MPPNQDPVITAGMMHTFTDLLVGDIKRSLAVWTRDDHRLFAFSARSQ